MPLTALLASLIAAAAPSPQPTTQLVVAPCQLGDRQQFEVASCDIELRNTGDVPITISNARAVFAWDAITPGVVVPPRGAAYLKATSDLRDASGYSKHTFTFSTSESGAASIRASNAFAFVHSVLDDPTPAANFGTIKAGERGSKTVVLSSREVADFRILAIDSAPPFAEAKILPDGRSIEVKIKPDAPWGIVHDKIKLKTNVPQQTQAWVTVDANVIGEIAANGNPFAFGLMRTNEKHEHLVRLTSESGKDFRIGKVQMDGIKGTVEAVPCLPAAKGCRMLRVQVSNDQGQGRLQGTISVELPEFKRTLPIQAIGMLLAPEVKVHDFNDEIAKNAGTAGAASPAAPSASAPPANSVDLKRAIGETPAAEAVAPPGTGPLLKWSVANEEAVYAYLIFRADEQAGPFLRVSKDLIKAKTEDGTALGSHQWRDTSAVSGRTYWYTIGFVKINGEKASLGEAQKVVAK